MTKALIAAWHPGPARALSRVAKRIIADCQIQHGILAHETARDVFKEERLQFSTINDHSLIDAGPRSMDSLLERERPDIVLTGVSAQDKEHPYALEQTIVLAARKARIPSIALIESWMPEKYARLFSNINPDSTIDYAGGMKYLPETIAIPDQEAKKDMINEGFKEDGLVITGSPLWDAIGEFKSRATLEDYHRVRYMLDIPPKTYVVHFFSQPIESQFGLTKGYTEKTALEELIAGYKQLETKRTELGKSTLLLVRAHPRETKTEPECAAWEQRVNYLAKKYGVEHVKTMMGMNTPMHDLIWASDVYISMSSTLLFDAAALCKPVISLQPGIKQEYRDAKDPVMENRRGLAVPVYENGTLGKILAELGTNMDYHLKLAGRSAEFGIDRLIDGRCTERVADLVYRKLGI